MRREGGITSSKLFWVTLSLLVLFVLSSVLPRNFFLPFRFVFQTVTSPFQNAFSGVGFFFRDISGTFVSIGDLKRENARLQDESIQWQSDQAKLADTEKENEELRRELALPLRKRFETRAVSVIARDPTERGKWLVINEGALDGLKKGMAVVATQGVMTGVIDEVYPNSARVMLLSHPENALPGRIAGQNTRGIIRGEHALGMVLGMISQADTVSEGDSVVTDDLEQNIPGGLLIGVVKSIQPSSDRLFLEASVVAPFRSDSLRFVSVLLAERESE